MLKQSLEASLSTSSNPFMQPSEIKIGIDLGNGIIEPLCFSPLSDPSEIAKNFCSRHDLTDDAVQILTEQIQGMGKKPQESPDWAKQSAKSSKKERIIEEIH